MNPTLAFNLQIGFGAIVCAIVAKSFVWPKLKVLPLNMALLPLLLVSCARFLGLTFIVGNLNPGLPEKFATSVGYGDFAAAVIALLAVIAVIKMPDMAKGFAWLYAIFGALDFLYGVYLATVLDVYSSLGVSWLVMIVVGPIQIMTMIMLWALLLRKQNPVM